jgi:hypothetical protein
MPRGPKGEKRRAVVIGAAVVIGKIATGEIDDLPTDDGKNAAAAQKTVQISNSFFPDLGVTR